MTSNEVRRRQQSSSQIPAFHSPEIVNDFKKELQKLRSTYPVHQPPTTQLPKEIPHFGRGGIVIDVIAQETIPPQSPEIVPKLSQQENRENSEYFSEPTTPPTSDYTTERYRFQSRRAVHNKFAFLNKSVHHDVVGILVTPESIVGVI